MFPRASKLLLMTGTALAAATVAGCGDDGGGMGPEATDVNGYMRALPAWTDFAPQDTPRNEPVGEPSDPTIFSVGATEYTCTTTPYSITDTPDRITIFNPDSEILWLGSLLQGKGHRDGLGSLSELPIRQRAPLTVFTDLLTENTAMTVENPDPSTMAEAIGGLIEQAEAAGHQAGSKIFFDMKQTHSLQQASLELGVSARYMGTTVESELGYQQELEENTLTAYFVQQMYTTSMVLPQTPGELFSERFTQADLQAQIDLGRVGPENLPTYVSNIVWGRMLMVTMTSRRSFEEMEAALSASNASIGGATIGATHLQVLSESSFRVSTVGGNDEGVEALIQTGQLGDYFDASLSLTEARPLSYTVRNLGDNSIATVSETTQYNLKTCSTGPATPTGATYRITIDKLEHVSNGCDGGFSPNPEVYYSFSLTTGGGTSVIASRSSGAAVNMSPGGILTIGSAPRSVNLYEDGRGTMRVTGTVWDYDSGSADEVMGTWDLSYAHGTATGQLRYTRSGDGCTIRMFLTITKTGDLYN